MTFKKYFKNTCIFICAIPELYFIFVPTKGKTNKPFENRLNH